MVGCGVLAVFIDYNPTLCDSDLLVGVFVVYKGVLDDAGAERLA